MIMLAKIALGFASSVAVVGAYSFHDGVIRVDVDEYRQDGSHVHLWLPAAAIPMAMHLMPRHELDNAIRKGREWMPVARVAASELGRLPNTTLVEVQDRNDHVLIATQDGALRIDVTEPGQTVHVVCPLATIEDVSSIIDSSTDSGA